jgi:hypothetical protein
MKTPLSLFAVAFLAGLSYTNAQYVAPVSPPSGGFHIDGNLQANSPTAGVGDWIPGSAGAGGYVMDSAGVPLDTNTTFHFVDAWNGSDDVHGNSTHFNENPNIWAWTTGSAPGKTDLNNVLIHFTKHETGCHKWVMFAADRWGNTGTSYVDFEFLQNTVTRTGTISGGYVSSGPNDGRTVNDFLFTAQLTGGGMPINFVFYKWAQTSPGVYDYVQFTPPAGSSYGFTSAGGESVPYSAFGSTTYLSNQFVEGAVDLDALVDAYITSIDSVVFKTLFIKTKVSTSPTASLADIIAPKQLNNLSINCIVGINEINLSNQVSIMPNPVNDKLTISFDEQSSVINAQLEIYNLAGEKVYSSKIKNTRHETFDVSGMAPGFYSVHLVTDKGSAVKKMVKQ